MRNGHTRRSVHPVSNRRVAAAFSESEDRSLRDEGYAGAYTGAPLQINCCHSERSEESRPSTHRRTEGILRGFALLNDSMGDEGRGCEGRIWNPPLQSPSPAAVSRLSNSRSTFVIHCSLLALRSSAGDTQVAPTPPHAVIPSKARNPGRQRTDGRRGFFGASPL